MCNIAITRKPFPGAFLCLVVLLLDLAYPVPLPAKSRPRNCLPQGDEQFDIIHHTTTSPTLDIWQINKPDVRRKVTEYPQITFRDGDRIIVSATGCVQTGGVGKTWKHYLNPKGADADRLYHGLVWIPGATAGPVRIKDVQGKRLAIPLKADIPQGLYLRLGYEDDHYEDNGYHNHDDGNFDQCKKSGRLWSPSGSNTGNE